MDATYFVVSAFRRNQDKRTLAERDAALHSAPSTSKKILVIENTPKIWSHKGLNLLYPEGDKDALNITTKQVGILDSTAFLDDVLMDFYMRFLQSSFTELEKKKFYFFNSFLFKKLLVTSRRYNSNAEKFKYAFEAVKNWNYNGSIFKKDYLLIPVNEKLHWSLIIVCHPALIGSKLSENASCILHLDPIKGYHIEDVEEHIRNFLFESWLNEHPNVDATSMKTSFFNIKYIEAKVPQQQNDYDCGIYTLHFAERFVKDSAQLRLITKDWFQESDISSKRNKIRDIIYSLEKMEKQNPM